MRITRRLVLTLVVLAASVLVVDQLTKLWAVGTLSVGERTPLIGDLLGLSLLYNPGAALSIATGMTWVFTVAAVVVTVVIVRVANRLGSLGWTIALGLLLGGALGNLTDRLLRAPGVGRGHVVDFIAYGDLFVGNVADIAIVAAAGLIVLLTLRGVGVDGSRPEPDAADVTPEPEGSSPAATPSPDAGHPTEAESGAVTLEQEPAADPLRRPRHAQRSDVVTEDG